MKAWISIAALAAALSFGASSAQAAPSAMAKACAKDIKSVCADVKPGGGKLKACVKEHFSDLSTDCQIAIVKAAAVGRACKADAKKLCSDVKPGKGRDGRMPEVACRRPQRRLQGRDGEGGSRKQVAYRLRFSVPA